MKHQILKLAATLSLLACLVLTSCSAISFDWDKSVEKLMDNGYRIQQTCTTEGELFEVTSAYNLSIKLLKGDFAVECTKYTNLEKGSVVNACTFAEFATEEQAEKYFTLYTETRESNSMWKLAIYGRVVVSSNNSESIALIGEGDFK